MPEKTCTKCHQTLPFESFYRSPQGRNGLSPVCIECHRQRSRDYYQGNKERMLDGFKQYAQANRKALTDYGRSYYARNSSKICEQTRKRMSEPERKANAKRQRKTSQQALRAKILNHLGGRCYCCGLDDLRFLTIDHINNDGRIDRKLPSGKSKNGYMILLDIQREGIPKDRYRAACYNCNCARNWTEGKICPHQLPS